MLKLTKILKMIRKYEFNWIVESTDLDNCFKVTVCASDFGDKYDNIVFFVEGKYLYLRDAKNVIIDISKNDIEIYLDALKNAIDEDIKKEYF